MLVLRRAELLGLLVLVQFNAFAIALGFASLIVVAIYPFAKRVTYWPQFVLGLTFNWGALLGWAAVTGGLAAPALVLYAAGVMWTLGYDTIYAHQDTEDDALIGVKSTALRLGEKTLPALGLFFAMTITLFALAGALLHAHVIYYIALLPAAAHFVWQLKHLDIHNSAACLALFKSNRNAGLLLLLSPLCELALRSI